MSEWTTGRSGPSLLQSIAELFGDYSDLVQKEIRLARAEIVDAVSRRVRAGAMLGVAGFFGLVAFLLIVEGIVFAIAAAGLALYWSCFLVAFILIVGAGGVYAYVRSVDMPKPILKRSLEQVRRDIRIVKEQAR